MTFQKVLKGNNVCIYLLILSLVKRLKYQAGIAPPDSAPFIWMSIKRINECGPYKTHEVFSSTKSDSVLWKRSWRTSSVSKCRIIVKSCPMQLLLKVLKSTWYEFQASKHWPSISVGIFVRKIHPFIIYITWCTVLRLIPADTGREVGYQLHVYYVADTQRQRFTPMDTSESPINLIWMSGAVGGNWNTQRKPTQAQWC